MSIPLCSLRLEMKLCKIKRLMMVQHVLYDILFREVIINNNTVYI